MNSIKMELEDSIKDTESAYAAGCAIDAFRQGYLLSLSSYAHWKDGIEYVGNCGRTLKEAKKELEDVIEEVLKQEKLT